MARAYISVTLIANWNKQLATKEKEFQIRHGFVPIPKGLKPFEDRICERANTAKHSIKLCLSTPLLYSLKADPWSPYNRKFIDKKLSDYWPNEFCEQFRDILRNHVSKGSQLDVELIYLDDKSTEKLLKGMNPNVPFSEHKESLNFFIGDVLENDENAKRKLCNLKVHRVVRVPFYLALFDADELTPCSGIVAFTNDGYLLNENEKDNKNSDDQAKELQAYEFTNPQVVKFLNQIFEQTKLMSDARLVDFLEICIASGFSWSAIANGVPGSLTNLKPHSTMLHTELTS